MMQLRLTKFDEMLWRPQLGRFLRLNSEEFNPLGQTALT